MISVFILPSNHFRNWDAQREELTDAQREKEREKERLIDAVARSRRWSRSRLRADRDLAFALIAISPSTAPIVISPSSRSRSQQRAVRSRLRLRRTISPSPSPHDLAPRRTQLPLSLPSSLNLTGFDDFFFLGFVCVSILRNKWYYIFVWQPRKCEKIWLDLMIFFSGFCLCFCIKEWMILYIRLATEKMWENVSNK